MRTVVLGALAFCTVGTSIGCTDNSASLGDRAPAVATIVRPSVAWPPKGMLDARALASLGRDDDDIRARLAQSPVPVLAPKDLVLGTPTLVVESEYYALTGRVAGATIALQGTRAAHRHQGVEPASGNRDVRGTKGFVSVNEGIRTVSWIENGAAYSVDVECADLRDARCASDQFVLEVVDQLTFVGGAGR